jgi:hypothetical protein
VIVGVFIFAWIASLIIYRYARLDELEVAPTRGRHRGAGIGRPGASAFHSGRRGSGENALSRKA